MAVGWLASNSAGTEDRPCGDGDGRCARRGLRGVPMAVASGVVAEYVPGRLHTAPAAARGLPDPGSGAKRHGDGGALSTRRTAAATASAAGQGSAGVKRLEKAGQAKGTPTLLDMRAKAKPRTEGGAP